PGAGRDREQRPVCSALLQRRRARLEHPGGEHPVPLGCGGSRLWGAALFPARRGRAHSPSGHLWHSADSLRRCRVRRPREVDWSGAARLSPGEEFTVRQELVLRRRSPFWAGLLVGLLTHGLATGAALGDSGWSVRSFDVVLGVQTDASLEVSETIDADFDAHKHGIYREIPIRYAVGLHQYALRFQWLGVDDGAGTTYESSVTYEENRVRIRIGRANRSLTGPVRYHIRYRVMRAILWEGNRAWGAEARDRDRAVLRWNATGTEWGVPIRRCSVTVRLPRELDDSQVVADAWTGAYGAKNKDFTKRRVDARTIAFQTAALRPGEGITIDVTMPADAVARPGWAREL